MERAGKAQLHFQIPRKAAGRLDRGLLTWGKYIKSPVLHVRLKPASGRVNGLGGLETSSRHSLYESQSTKSINKDAQRCNR